MRLVMIVHFTDGYTYSCYETFPVYYESTEKALVDFEEELTNALNKKVGEFEFFGETFVTYDFVRGDYSPDPSKFPEFLTIDEWFGS